MAADDYTVYILHSLRNGRYYIGHTADVKQRLAQHNLGRVKSTKAFRPWEIVYFEKHPTKQLAYAREMKIKSYKSGKAFQKLIGCEKQENGEVA